MTRRDVHAVAPPHVSCPAPSECDCECRACKRTWESAGRPTPEPTELKIEQIIPAMPGWTVAIDVGEEKRLTESVACWALLSDGSVVAMVGSADTPGRLELAQSAVGPYGPPTSWVYKLTEPDQRPVDGLDWEFVAMTETRILWRRDGG